MTNSPSFAEIDVKGADARSFLHSQFASDIQAIETGHWGYGSYCVADGRVQALMMIARRADDQYRLLLPADLAAAVAERLQRYRLRARCTLASQAVAIAAPGAGGDIYACDAFAWSVQAVAEPIAVDGDLWTRQVALGIPWIVAATSAQFLPQMLALERLRALSLRKGCFPGQEVVARTHFLGRVKRRLVALDPVEAGALAAPGCGLLAAGSNDPVGSLIAIADSGRALAVVSEAAHGGTSVQAESTHPAAAFVIDRDINETIGDGLLNGSYTPHSAHGVSATKMV